MPEEQWFRLVVRPARSRRKAEKKQSALRNAPCQQEEKQRLNNVRLVLADGTEYRGAVTSGINQKQSNTMLLTFEMAIEEVCYDRRTGIRA